MTVEVIQVKEKEYFKVYKEIVKLCLKEGVLLPSLLEMINVPEKYDFTEKEIEKLKISEESSSLRQQAYMDRQEKLGQIHYDGDFIKMNDELNTVDNEELMSFIGRYPQYQKLLKLK